MNEKNDHPILEQPSESPSVPPKPRARSRFAIVIAVLSLIIALAGIAAFVLTWQRLSNVQEKMALRNSDLQREQVQMQASLAQQQQGLSSTQANLQQVIQLSQRKSQDWVLAEAEYLVRLAAFNLTFENNIAVARKLLETADQRIQTLADPSLSDIRQALANNITALNSIQIPDLTGLVTRLNAISQEVGKLPVTPSQPTNAGAASATTPTSTQPMWRRILSGISDTLKDMVVIRTHQKPMKPLLPPEQQVYLVQNIQVQLSLAQWAALHQQPDIYKQTLQQAIDWISQYFAQNAAATENAISTLKNLQSWDIKPTVPDLSDTIKMIDDALNKKASNTTTPQPLSPGQESLPI